MMIKLYHLERLGSTIYNNNNISDFNLRKKTLLWDRSPYAHWRGGGVGGGGLRI